MPPVGGIWAPVALRVLRQVVLNTSKMVRTKLAEASRPIANELQPVAVRSAPGGSGGRQPIHPAAFLRQKKSGRWYSTNVANVHATVRRYLSTGPAGYKPRFDRSKFPVSNTSRAVSQLPGRAPFASTLRPNLTGGTLGRTAGGYASPGAGRTGGQRYFSHTPAAPAQVVQNVSMAMRAFWTSGQRARYDGVGPSGCPKYRAVTTAHEEAALRLASGMKRLAPGAYVEFRTGPTITALSPLAAAFPYGNAACLKAEAGAATLNTEGFLDVLSVDFARALKDLAAVMTDLKKLAELGDLPITLEKDSVIRVSFPGVDAGTVERLCDDLGVQRGVIRQDRDFDDSAGVEVALRFPFAPDAAKTMTSPGGSVRSHDSDLSIEDAEFLDEFEENPWLTSTEPEGYESMSPPVFSTSGEHCSEEFEGLEGIYRFLEECDRARGRF